MNFMQDNSGVKINLVSRETIQSMNSQQKVDFIIDQVMKGTVLVLETGLTSLEEAELYKKVMEKVDNQTFIGIEIQGISPAEMHTTNWLDRLLKRRRKELPRMSVIGPAKLLRTIYKDGREIQAIIVTKEGGAAPPIEVPDSSSGGDNADDMDSLFKGIGDEEEEKPETMRPVPSDIKGSGFAKVLKDDN